MGLLDWVKGIVGGAEGEAEDAPKAAAVTPQKSAEIEQALRQAIAEQSDGELTAEAIDAQAPLLDEGYLDSLSSVKVLVLIEQRYGIAIEEAELTGRLHTLDALVEHIAAQAQQSTEADGA